MRHSLLRSVGHSVALGLSLATLSLAHAAPARPTAAQVKAQRNAMRAHLELSEIVRGGVRGNEHFASLLQHHDALGPIGESMRIAGTEKDAIVVDNNGAMFSVKAGVRSPAQGADLVRLNIASKDALDHAMASRLMEIAGVRGTPNAKSIEKATVKLTEQVQQSSEVFGRTWAHQFDGAATDERLALLARNHVTNAPANHPVPNHLEFATDTLGGKIFIKQGSYPMYVDKDGGQRQATARDVHAAGIKSHADFDHSVAKMVMHAAGAKGDVTDKRVVDRAAKTIERRLDEVQELQTYIADATQHEDIALLVKTRDDLATRNGATPKQIALASTKTEKLVVGGLGYNYAYRRNIVTNGLFVEDANGASRAATPADLARFNVASKRTFDAAAQRALFEIASEDLDTK